MKPLLENRKIDTNKFYVKTVFSAHLNESSSCIFEQCILVIVYGFCFLIVKPLLEGLKIYISFLAKY